MIFGVGEPKLKLTKNALKVLESRYLLKDEEGKLAEKPLEMFRRVAGFIIKAEDKYNLSQEKRDELERAFLEAMVNLEFLPNSPTFTGAGTKLGQLSACFVLPVDDSMEGIFEAIKNTALIHKSGGGTGFSFSRLRPAKDRVSSTSGSASGPISFMSVFDAATDTIKQGGTRRGANMGILRIDHPDILEFIACKADNNKLNNFNISVAITDKFMAALDKDDEYDLVNPRDGKNAGRLSAKEVWDKIVSQAWKNGDPGVIFIDTINKFNPTPHAGQIESTNPCGEQPLLPYESCNLGSINLANFCQDGKINYERLEEVVKIAVRFLDNVIDLNKYPIAEIDKTTKGNRKIGLGIMGWADLLVQLNIAYNSQEAINLAEKAMKFIKTAADQTSVALAKEKGVFPNFEGSLYDTAESDGIRNATRTTIAPTGTLSVIANCSSGIEPYYALAYVRKSHIGKKGDEWVELVEVNPFFEEIAKAKGFYSRELMEKVSEHGSIKDLAEVPEAVKRIFVTAHDIAPDWHIRMQAAFQKYVDNAVSKTINFPNSAAKEDVAKAYLLAYETGCKGVTIYRDGSREVQVLTAGKSGQSQAQEPAAALAAPFFKRERPSAMRGTTYKINTSYGDLFVTINDDEQNKPFEVFATIGKAGGFFSAKSEAVCRLISLALRSNIPAEEVIKQIKGIRGPMPSWTEWGMVLSLPDAIAQILEHHLTREQPQLGLEFHSSAQVSKESMAKPPIPAAPLFNHNGHGKNGNGLNLKRSIADFGTAPECPECGSLLEIAEGCLKCRGCGFSKCG